MKKILSAALAATVLSSSFLALAACGPKGPVLKIASWEEYIDEGGPDSYKKGSKSLVEEFEDWYYEQTNEKIRVEYIPLQDNETMYNQIKLGETYDLLCPSEYMIMKLASENRLEEFPDSFFDTSVATNYYINNVSPFIKDTFDSNTINGVKWSKYAAGYMWGTTGFVFNYEKISAEDAKSWNVYDKNYKISAKDNVRDSYFAGLGMYYEKDLLAFKEKLADDASYTLEAYKEDVTRLMNDTESDTMKSVEGLLKNMKSQSNFWGFETDNAKNEIRKGKIDISYQWSGDAVAIMDRAEKKITTEDGEDDEDSEISKIPPVRCDYCVPEAASNLWFDGWVMMKGAKTEAATMFVNFVSKPENAIRNMHYIGYTSCIGGDEVFDYVEEKYGADEKDATAKPYDLSYFFGDGKVLSAPEEQFTRQLFAQYPDEETMKRCVVMQYFDDATNTRANKMWQNVKAH